MRIVKITRKVSKGLYRTIYQYRDRYNKPHLITTLHALKNKPAITRRMIREKPNKYHNSCYTAR